MNKVYQHTGLTLLKFKNAGMRERWERGDKKVSKEEIYLPDAWFFAAANQEPVARFNDGVKIFSEENILDPDITKNRAAYSLVKIDSAKHIGGL